MAAVTDVEINPNNFLGNEYNAFRSQLYSFALSDPKGYFDLRTTVLEKVKNGGVQIVYKTIRKLLKEGKDSVDTEILRWGNKNHPPSYPSQKVEQICLNAADTYNEMIDNVIEILMPIDFKAIMEKTLAKVGAAQNPQGP